jgi:hypothetical protein
MQKGSFSPDITAILGHGKKVSYTEEIKNSAFEKLRAKGACGNCVPV